MAGVKHLGEGVKSSTGVLHYPYGQHRSCCGSCGLRWPCHYIKDRLPKKEQG